jgi:hypothetical protein
VGEGGFDVVLVRKSGPVQTMKFRSWWLYFLFLALLLMVAGLGAGAYLLYTQQQAMLEISEDTRLLMLRAERLESLSQEQETRALLAQQAEDERRAAEAAAKARISPREAAAERAKAEQAAKPVLPPEPKSSEHIKIANVNFMKRGGEVNIVFDVTNQRDPSDPAMGYVTVVARAQRAGKPWIEAWPPMRLSPLGRPLNYRRGTPFSVQRYRRLKASFAQGDKKFERVEFLIYSREGQLIMVHDVKLAPKEQQSSHLKRDASRGGKG